jgi:hypothetical protein
MASSGAVPQILEFFAENENITSAITAITGTTLYFSG